jgi:branched-chain amino acid transport system ATP-binding protein
MTAAQEIVRLTGVTKRFGGLVAVDQVSFSLAAGEVVGLIGPNGAGKTTLVSLMAQTLAADAGTVDFLGERLNGLPPHKVAARGLARTFQIVQPFPKMTVLENVAAGALFAGGASSVRAASQEGMDCLDFCGLADMAHREAASLTLPNRKRLEVAKALATRPKLLLLDEVNAGLTAAEVDTALVLIAALAKRGITILLIEHLMKVVLQACSRVIVLHQGALIADATPRAIVQDKAVADAYLGSRFAAGLAKTAGGEAA